MSDHSNRARPWVSITDRQLIRRQRLRLTLVNVAVLALIWAMLGTFVYSLLVRQTNGSVDSRLYQFAEQLMMNPALGLRDGDFSRSPQPTEGDLLSATWVTTGGLHLWGASAMPSSLLAKLGDLAHSSAVGTSPFTAYVGGIPYRILQFSEGYAPVTVQVMEDVRGQYDVLHDLLDLIVVAGAFGVALAAIGGYSLGLWTLRPLMAARRREQELASDISHELRTPLSVMAANLELLLRHTGHGEQEPLRFVEAIYRENKRMKRLIDDLLDMARLDAGVDVVERQVFSLREICGDVAALYEPVVAEKGLRLQLDLPETDCRMSGDPARIRQLLFIFLDNACKYTSAGEIRLTLRKAGNHIELAVSDTGIGMSPQLLARATERFVRGDEARGNRTSSMGLGLAIAKRIVATHQGKLVMRSAEGRGTQITVTLRTADGPEAGSATLPAPKS